MGFALTPGEAPLHFSRSKNVMHVVTVRVPFNGYELDDLEKQIDRCFNED